MTSTRLPGKILVDLAGRPMLAQELARLRLCKCADDIVIATTVNQTDDPVVELARKEGVGCFRGDENDVLSRYLGAARQARADVIVRITADCPLIDAGEVDRVVAALLDGTAKGNHGDKGLADYASNTLERTFPRGLDAEAFHRDVLERVARMGHTPLAREHVTYFIHRERPELFVKRSVTSQNGESHADLRWTVDEPVDLALVRRIYELFALGTTPLPYADLINMVVQHPELAAMNAHVAQKHA